MNSVNKGTNWTIKRKKKGFFYILQDMSREAGFEIIRKNM